MKIDKNKIESIELQGNQIILNYKMKFSNSTSFIELPPYCSGIKFESKEDCIVSLILGEVLEANMWAVGQTKLTKLEKFLK
jgi:hypothetical protein